MIKSGAELEATMPNHKGIATVICFDLVSSSQLPQKIANDFIQNVVKSCLTIIKDDYNPRTMEASAYRIKEMGDGFLVSIGCPFGLAGDQSSAEKAIQLSNYFIKIVDEIGLDMGLDRQLRGIGIASGSLKGFIQLSARKNTTCMERLLYSRRAMRLCANAW